MDSNEPKFVENSTQTDPELLLKFPYKLEKEEISIDANPEGKFSESLIEFTKQALIDGFAKGVSLRDVARCVKDSMLAKNGGNWLCVIKPGQAEVGLSFHQSKILQASLMCKVLQPSLMRSN